MKLNNIFGTDGIREVFGSGILSESNLIFLAKALSIYFKANSKLLIGFDSRASGLKIKKIFNYFFTKAAHTVFDIGIVSTPALIKISELFKIYKQQSFDYLIMITASHNSAIFNGLKIMTNVGKIDFNEQLKISKLFYEISENFKFETFGTFDFECNNLLKIENSKNIVNSKKYYIDFLIKSFAVIDFSTFSVVFDCANGAVSEIAFEVCSKLNFKNCIFINNLPNGTNINFNCGTENLASLEKILLENNFDFGVAFDGDADRIIILKKKSNNKIIKLDGDDIFAILSKNNNYKNSTTFVGTILSNQKLEDFFIAQNKKFLRTAVGDQNIYTELLKNNALLGAEPSGHIIFSEYSFSSDALFSALVFFQTLSQYKNLKIPLFKKFFQISKNIKVAVKKEINTALILKDLNIELQNYKIVLRYSGTEPVLRVNVESRSKKNSEKLAEKIVKKLKETIL